ncbi:globin domain-containing protein [Pannonibacter sp. Pt2-lr]
MVPILRFRRLFAGKVFNIDNGVIPLRANGAVMMHAVRAQFREVEVSPEQIQLVQESFDRLRPQGPAVISGFYCRFFELSPSLRPLFRTALPLQEVHLLEALSAVVAMLSNLQMLLPELEALAKRHVTYGVCAVHYLDAGEALMWTLESHLGEAFTPEVRSAWMAAYATLSDIMIASAEYRAA